MSKPETTQPSQEHMIQDDVRSARVPGGLIEHALEDMRQMEHDETIKHYEGSVQFLGPIKSLVDDPGAEWTGAISVDSRIASGEITRDDVEHAKSRLGNFYMLTTPGTFVRCIDGRSRALSKISGLYNLVVSKASKFLSSHYGNRSTLIMPESEAFEELGPQIPGGTITGGVSFRHATSTVFSDFSKASIAADAEKYGERSTAVVDNIMGYLPGDHSAHPDRPGLGCGAVDGVEETHDKVNNRNIKTLHGLMSATLGGLFDETHFSSFVTSSVLLSATHSYFDSKEEAIQHLKDNNPNCLPELIGNHAEVILGINTVVGTTLHTDLFNAAMKAETGKDIQAFGYDIWYSMQMAEKLFPDSEVQRKRYIHCRVGLSLAAIMYLSDGTIEVAVRTPDQVEPIAA